MKHESSTKLLLGLAFLLVFSFFQIEAFAASVVFTANAASSSDLTTYNFTGLNFGTATSDRVIVVGVGGRGGTGTISSVSIAGIAATKVNGTGDVSESTIDLWYANVSSGTSGYVTVTFSSGKLRAHVGVWAVYDAVSAPYTSRYDSNAPSVLVDAPASSAVIGYSHTTSTGGTSTWTGLTENFDENTGEGSTYHSGASKNQSVGDSSYNVTNIGDAGTGAQDLLIVGVWQTSNTGPQYSNISLTPSSPQTFPVASIQFNITWNDTDGISRAWLIHDFNGTNATHFLGNTTPNNFNYTFNSPPAGSFTYRFYANDTLGATNSTEVLGYTISKASTVLNLSINDTHADVTYTYLNATNVTGNTTVSNGVLRLYRNGTLLNSSSTNVVTDIRLNAAGTWNYTLSFEHQNYTATNISRILTINKRDSLISITADPSFVISEGQSVNVTCTYYSGISTTLTRDGVTVSNPFVATLSFGTYNFTCTSSDTANYTPSSVTQSLVVSAGGFGCTNTNTFAFSKTVTPSTWPVNLNFTDLVNTFYVKSDLSDVYVNSSLGFLVGKNTTNGYYLVVNNTTAQTNFTVSFGNYVTNNSWSNYNQAATTENVTGYTQINSYYYLTYYNEQNGTIILPPGANTTQSLYCSGGTSSFPVSSTSTRLLVATFEELDSIRTTVSYSASEVYYRDYIVRGPVEFKNVYLVDANQDQVLQNLFKLEDRTGEFGNGTIFKVKRYLEGTLATITELTFDIEKKAIAFLINADKYQIYIDNGEEERAIGDIYIDPSGLTKNIIVQGISTYNLSVANSTANITFINGIFNFVWNDPSAQNNLVEFWVYNYTDGSQLYYASSSNKTRVNFVYTVSDLNGTYKTTYKVHHGFYGNNTLGWDDIWFGSYTYPLQNPLMLMITSLGGNIFWFVMFFVASIPFFFTKRHLGIGAMTLVLAIALYVHWKMIVVSGAVIGIGIFLALLIETNDRRKWRK